MEANQSGSESACVRACCCIRYSGGSDTCMNEKGLARAGVGARPPTSVPAHDVTRHACVRACTSVLHLQPACDRACASPARMERFRQSCVCATCALCASKLGGRRAFAILEHTYSACMRRVRIHAQSTRARVRVCVFCTCM